MGTFSPSYDQGDDNSSHHGLYPHVFVFWWKTVERYSVSGKGVLRGAVAVLVRYIRILISGVMANVFIVAINQLTDVDIDKANGKPLPIPAGELNCGNL